MRRKLSGRLAMAALGLLFITGCRGGLCSNCGAGYNGYAPPAAYPPPNVYQQGTWGQPQGTTVIQPPAGTVTQPGVILPQNVAPTQMPPGAVYGTNNGM